MKATDRFALRHGRYPGSGEGALEADAVEVASDLSALVTELGLGDSLGSAGGVVVGPKHAEEMTRYGGAEVHAVAAIIGGVAAQEAVKLLTGQYVPIDNTFIHNGIAGVSGAFKL
jgi:amyloid beta precursor protein binding protein 1